MSTRYLITGAQGFVGRYLVARLLAADPSAHVYGVGRSPRRGDVFTHSIRWGATRLAAPLPEELIRACGETRYRYTSADLHDGAGVRRALRECRPHVVVHLAAALRDHPAESLFRTNVVGTMRLMEAMTASGARRPTLIVGSTGGVYGEASAEELPLQEDAPLRPVDLYSISKLSAEQMAESLGRLHHIPVICARLFNLVGPGQDERHVCGKLASRLAAIARDEAPPHLEVGPLDRTRDFLDVRDAAQGLEILAERGAADTAYNLGSGDETSIDSVLRATLEVAGLTGQVAIERTAGRPRDVQRHVADINRMKALGFQPHYGLGQSIADLYRYYVDTVAEHASQGTVMAWRHAHRSEWP